jgi:hypothetical protein
VAARVRLTQASDLKPQTDPSLGWLSVRQKGPGGKPARAAFFCPRAADRSPVGPSCDRLWITDPGLAPPIKLRS